MKNIKLWLLALLFASMIFTSCQKSVPPQLNAIPKTAKFVLAVDNKQLIKKSGFDNLKDFNFYAKMRDAASDERIIDFLTGDKKLGLDKDQAYLFMEMQDERPLIVWVTAMKDQILFEQNLHDLRDFSSDAEIQDKLSYKLLVVNNNDNDMHCAWNDKLFFAFFGDMSALDYDRYFRLSAEESLMSDADFSNFIKRPSDIGFWLPMSAYANIYSKYVLGESFNLPMMNDVAGINMHVYLDFNNDEIKSEVFMTPEKEMNALHEKYPFIKWNLNKDIVKDFPATSYFAFKVAVDFPIYIKILNDVLSETGGWNSEWKYNMRQLAEALEDPTVNTIFNALAGDVIFSLYGFAEGLLPLPLMGLSFTVNNEDGFDDLLALMPEEMVKYNGKYYDLASTGLATVHFAYKDCRVFITDSEKSMDAFLSGGNSKNIAANSAIGKAMQTSPSVFYMNLNLDDYPKVIRDFINSSGYVDEEIVAALNIFKDFSVVMDSKYSMKASLKFKSSRENSLKQLVKLIDNLAN